MKLADIEEFAKQKKREHRMRIDKIKEAARQQSYDQPARKASRFLSEKCRYDAQYIWE